MPLIVFFLFFFIFAFLGWVFSDMYYHTDNGWYCTSDDSIMVCFKQVQERDLYEKGTINISFSPKKEGENQASYINSFTSNLIWK